MNTEYSLAPIEESTPAPAVPDSGKGFIALAKIHDILQSSGAPLPCTYSLVEKVQALAEAYKVAKAECDRLKESHGGLGDK